MKLDRLFPSLLMARRNLMRNRVRSGLACFGILIGVVAIASLGILGFTLQAGFMEEMGDVANEVEVTPAVPDRDGTGLPEPGDFEDITERELRDIQRASGDASTVPVKEKRVDFESGDTSTTVTALSVENPSALFEAEEGEVPQRLTRGVLIGSSIAEREEGINVGSAVTVDGNTHRVEAILKEEGFTATVTPNRNVIVPDREVRDQDYSRVIVQADSAEDANATAQRIKADLNEREEVVETRESADLIENIREQQRLLNMFLIGVGSISLFVAGVSILNVMLMSTVERREEIGVLRAVGVYRTTILKVLLAEAALLGFVGGGVGVLLSILIGGVINQFMLDSFASVFRPGNIRYLIIAMGFAVGISLLSGVYPAWKAANERPVEALRG